MSLISLIIVLIIVGLLLWLINFLPMDAKIKQIITVLVVVVVILWILSILLGYGGLGSIRIGPVR